jgi:hypothetical protein
MFWPDANQDVEACLLRGSQNLSVFHLRAPARLYERAYFIVDQKPPHANWAFLSNRMRNAVALGVGHNGSNTLRRHLELFRNFGNGQTVVAAQNR